MIALTPAERILKSLGIESPGEIDLEAIAWTRVAVVNYRPLDRCEATIVGSRKRAVIAVNSRSPPDRRRFSLAHELGHWHHHKGKMLFCGGRDVCNFANGPLDPERQADAFASDLILPNYLLGPRLRRIKRPTLAAAREIADEYSASLTAMLFKMTVLNRFPIIIACYDKTKRRWFGGFPCGGHAVRRRRRRELPAEDAGGRVVRLQRMRPFRGRRAVLPAARRGSPDRP
jgi:hypothetical protein